MSQTDEFFPLRASAPGRSARDEDDSSDGEAASRSSGRPKRIGLLGQFGSGNFGNDGSLEAMVLSLRRAWPDATIRAFCFAPAKIRDGFGIAAAPFKLPFHGPRWLVIADRLCLGIPHKIGDWVHSFRCLYGIDILMVPGTGILDDFGTGPFSMPFALLGWCVAARLRGVTLAFVAIGAGPIQNRLSRYLMGWAARLAHFRSYRDVNSKDFVESIGLDVRQDPICPDLAFSLPAPAAGADRRAQDGRVTVGLGVMTYSGWENDHTRGREIYLRYIAQMADFVSWLLDAGHHVRILMGDDGDRVAVADVLNAVATRRPDVDRGAIWSEPSDSLNELMAQIAQTDVVVAMRFHNIVCALRVGKPCISIGYAMKNRALMEDMGLGAFCHDVDGLDSDELKRDFAALLADRLRLTAHLATENERYGRKLDAQYAIVDDLVAGSGRQA